MKGFIGLFLAVCMALSLAACGSEDASGSMQPSQTPYAASGSESEPGASSSLMDDLDMDDSGMTGSMPQASGSQASTATQAAAAAAAFSEGDWSLTLVNANNPLPLDFAPNTVSIPGYDSRLFDQRAADALIAMLDAAQADGQPLYLVSSYRSIQRQTALFQRKTNYYKQQGLDQAQAEAQAATLVARPGESEHNLGLAADIVSADWYSHHDDLTEEFESTAAFAWLDQHAAEYGFILRYPKGAETITGVDYEPWHYRYVGPTAAGEIKQKGITLEEYLNKTS